jgi:Phage integrase family
VQGAGQGTASADGHSELEGLQGLKAYLTVRPADAQDDQVLQTKYRHGMGPRSIEDVVSKYVREAGITGASVHTLRHTFATHQVKLGTSIKAVQDALGHSSLKTTTIYVSLARGGDGPPAAGERTVDKPLTPPPPSNVHAYASHRPEAAATAGGSIVADMPELEKRGIRDYVLSQTRKSSADDDVSIVQKVGRRRVGGVTYVLYDV